MSSECQLRTKLVLVNQPSCHRASQPRVRSVSPRLLEKSTDNMLGTCEFGTPSGPFSFVKVPNRKKFTTQTLICTFITIIVLHSHSFFLPTSCPFFHCFLVYLIALILFVTPSNVFNCVFHLGYLCFSVHRKGNDIC